MASLHERRSFDKVRRALHPYTFATMISQRKGFRVVEVHVCINSDIVVLEEEFFGFPSELLMTKLALLTGGPA
jgi:hypothetical protein